MITYFDTSAVIPLIIGKPSTIRCERIWNESTRVLTVRLLYPEARASLARAERMGRLSQTQHARSVVELDALMDEIDVIEIDAAVARTAGELAQAHQLRGYDPVHLAAAVAAADDDLVVAAGDAELLVAARSLGLAVADTNG